MDFVRIGGDGVISVTANVAPLDMHRYDLALILRTILTSSNFFIKCAYFIIFKFHGRQNA